MSVVNRKRRRHYERPSPGNGFVRCDGSERIFGRRRNRGAHTGRTSRTGRCCSGTTRHSAAGRWPTRWPR